MRVIFFTHQISNKMQTAALSPPLTVYAIYRAVMIVFMIEHLTLSSLKATYKLWDWGSGRGAEKRVKQVKREVGHTDYETLLLHR